MISMSTCNDTEPQFIACFCVCRMFSKDIEHLSHQATKKCTATLPVRQRREITIPEAKWSYWDHGNHQYCVSKIMIRILRHRNELLEADGAVAWKTLWSRWTSVMRTRMMVHWKPRKRIGLTSQNVAAVKNGFNIAWTMPATFCTCEQCKVILDEPKLICHCRMKCKFLTSGLNIFTMLLFR